MTSRHLFSVPAPGPAVNTSKSHYLVTITKAVRDDNSPFVNNLLEMIVGKNIFGADVANGLLATFGQ